MSNQEQLVENSCYDEVPTLYRARIVGANEQ